MKNRDEIKDELKELSPFLLKHKNEQEGYGVPKDYFKSLPDEVMNQLGITIENEREEKENWFAQLLESIQYFFQPRYALAYASVALLVMVGLYFTNKTTTDYALPIAAATILNELPDDILNEYISTNIGEFDETTLTEEIADNVEVSLPGLDLENDEELMDELIEDLDLEDLEDFF